MRYESVVFVRLVIVVRASYTPPARLAQPDPIADARAYGKLHLVGVEGSVRSEARAREGPEGGLGTRKAEAAVSIPEDDGSRWLDRTVLSSG